MSRINGIVPSLAVLWWLLLQVPREALAQITFDLPVPYTTISQATAVVAADFNRDGHQDLVLGTIGGIIEVFLNVGDGRLLPPRLYAVTGFTGRYAGFNAPKSLAAADFNGDGYPDLAVLAGSQIAVLLNNKDGTFAPPVFYPTGQSFSASIIAGDFFRDGLKHLAVIASNGTFGNPTLRFFTNNGSGTFSQVLPGIPVGAAAADVIAVDVDNDGFLDMVVNNGYQSPPVFFSVWRNNRNKTFSPFGTYQFATGNGGPDLTAADLNGDGYPDLIYTYLVSAGNTGVKVLLNNKDGTFGPPQAYTLTNDSDSCQSESVKAADIDGDNHVDLIVGAGNCEVILHNHGDGTFDATQTILQYPVLEGGNPSFPLLVDLNGDGRPDLVTTDGRLGPDGNFHLYVWINRTSSHQACDGHQIILILPNHGGNAGSATVQFYGCGFQSGLTVKLTGLGADILGTNTILSTGGSFTTTFDLTGAPPGLRRVVVTNPDSTSATLAGGFTVEQGGAPEIWVDLIGRSALRAGMNQAYYIVVGNRGNLDADTASICVKLPSFIGFTTSAQQTPSDSVQIGESTLLFYDFVGPIPAGATYTFTLFLNAPTDEKYAHLMIEIDAWSDTSQ